MLAQKRTRTPPAVTSPSTILKASSASKGSMSKEEEVQRRDYFSSGDKNYGDRDERSVALSKMKGNDSEEKEKVVGGGNVMDKRKEVDSEIREREKDRDGRRKGKGKGDSPHQGDQASSFTNPFRLRMGGVLNQVGSTSNIIFLFLLLSSHDLH